MNSKLLCLALVASLSTTNVFAASWEVLTGSDLEAAFADKTVIGKKYAVYYDGNGEMRGSWGGKKYTGKYFFKNDVHYCSVWNEHDRGGEQEGCWTVEKKKSKLRIQPVSGRASQTQVLKTKTGNVKNI